jgi:hypothetical protein
MNKSNTPRFNLPNQVSYAKEKFSAYLLGSVFLLLIFGSLGLAFLDPSIRPLFLDLAKNLGLAYMGVCASLPLTQNINK